MRANCVTLCVLRCCSVNAKRHKVSDFYDNDSAEEHAETTEKLNNAVQTLRDAADAIVLLKDSNDTGSMSNDAYTALVNMLRELNNNYNIEQLVQDALADE